jgi:hypothetical protein
MGVWDVSVSPDGRRLALATITVDFPSGLSVLVNLIRPARDVTETVSVWTCGIDGSSMRELAHAHFSATNGGLDPWQIRLQWKPSGRAVSFWLKQYLYSVASR